MLDHQRVDQSSPSGRRYPHGFRKSNCIRQGFICADVTKYTDLKQLGTEKACKEEGKVTQAGKTYVVQDGDIIFFKFNVSKGK
jgi:hypothetical protein